MQHFNPARFHGLRRVRAEAPSDPTAIMAEITKAFETFKAEHKAAIAAKADDAVTGQKLDAINATITNLQEALVKATRAEAEAKAAVDKVEAIDRIVATLGKGTGTPIDFKAHASTFLSGKLGLGAHLVRDDEVAAYTAYASMFGGLMKSGEPKFADEKVRAAMSVGSDPDGGYWVPTQQSNAVIRRVFESSDVRRNAAVMSITTDSIAFPTDVNTGTSGGWVSELGTRSDTATPQVGEHQIYVHEQYAQPKASQKLLDMATINVEAWLAEKIADILARTENTAFVTGNGVGKPRGFMSYSATAVTTADASRAWGLIQYIVSGASGGFPTLSGIPSASDVTGLINAIAALKPIYRNGAKWFCSRATEAAIRALVDGNGRHLVGMGDVRDNVRGFNLLGYDIETMEDMAAIGANSFSMAFGNLMVGYQIVDGRGIRILRDPYTEKPYVKFYTTKWTGGDVVNFDAIKYVKFGTS